MTTRVGVIGARGRVGSSIVEAVTATGFTAIEGNTSFGDDTDGGRVMRRKRSLADVDGFGRI